jgi:hypothetical protein
MEINKDQDGKKCKLRMEKRNQKKVRMKIIFILKNKEMDIIDNNVSINS